MKLFFTSLLFLFSAGSALALEEHKNFNEEFYEDSSLRARFIKGLLEYPAMDSVWILIKVDSLNLLEENFELVHPVTLYNTLAESFLDYNRKDFVSGVFETILYNIPFERYADKKNQLKGIKIDLKKLKLLAEKDFNVFLNKYFNKDHTLKSKYNHFVYEIIAVAYLNNTKVMMCANGIYYYEIFK